MIKIGPKLLKNSASDAELLRPELKLFLERASTVLVDKQIQLRLAWCCLLAAGHLLIEDVPGVGKTTMVKLIARLFNLPWKRIQCTSDLLPADITGGSVYDEKKGEFSFIKGPLFANLVMADELNRASPKSQSAFLQAMEEGSVTVDGVTHLLPSPFIVIATQNSMDSAGTNPLPESQLDRFMMSIGLGLPAREGERRLITEPPRSEQIEIVEPLFAPTQLSMMRKSTADVHISDNLADYILNLADWIRKHAEGCSPRAVLALTACSKAWAFGNSRSFVQPSDVQAVASAVLSHRLIAKNTLGADRGVDIVDKAIQSIAVDV